MNGSDEIGGLGRQVDGLRSASRAQGFDRVAGFARRDCGRHDRYWTLGATTRPTPLTTGSVLPAVTSGKGQQQ